MFMDVDDKIIKSELDIAISMIRRGVDIYFFKAKRIIHEDVIIERTWKPELFFHDYTGPAFKKPNIVIDTIVMNKIFSRDFIIGNSIKFPSGKYEDKIFMTEILLKNPIIHISDISYYRWLVYPNAGSQTNVKNLDDVIQRFNACEKQLQLSKETPFFIETFSNIFNHDITLYSKNFESHCIEIKEELYHRLCHFRCLPKKPTLSKLGKAVYESKDFSSFCAIMNTPSIIPSTTRDKFIKWSSKILDSFRLHKKLSH